MRRQKLFLLVNIFIIMLFLCSCTKQPEQALPRLVIGYDNYRPYSYFDEDGEPAGITMEIAREACQRLGYEPVFTEIDWDRKDSYLESGEIDCVWGCFSMNGLEDEYSWVGPYMNGRQVVAVLENSNLQYLNDLKGKRIAVKAGTQPESIFLGETDREIPQVQVVYSLTDVDEVVTALRNDYVDACAGYSATLIYLLEKADVQYRFLEEDLLHSKLGVAFLKESNPELRGKLDMVLREMQEDGTTEKILTEHGLDADRALGGINGD